MQWPFSKTMATIRDLLKRVEKSDMQAIAVQSLEATKEAIADLNAEQMHKGKRSDETDILPDYRDVTIAIKKLKGQPTDRVTLFDTGDFYRGITVTVMPDVVSITSIDPKTGKLNKKYSTAKGNIFGLGGPFKREYINEHLRPMFITSVRKEIGL